MTIDDGYVTIRQEQFDALIQRKIKDTRRAEASAQFRQAQSERGNFIQVLQEPCQILVRNRLLSNGELALLFRLLPFAQKKTNIVTDECGVFMNIAAISTLAGSSYAHTSRTLSSLAQKGMLSKFDLGGGNTGVKLNKAYFFNGAALDWINKET